MHALQGRDLTVRLIGAETTSAGRRLDVATLTPYDLQTTPPTQETFPSKLSSIKNGPTRLETRRLTGKVGKAVLGVGPRQQVSETRAATVLTPPCHWGEEDRTLQ
jgi:hypothetical protein